MRLLSPGAAALQGMCVSSARAQARGQTRDVGAHLLGSRDRNARGPALTALAAAAPRRLCLSCSVRPRKTCRLLERRGCRQLPLVLSRVSALLAFQ